VVVVIVLVGAGLAAYATLVERHAAPSTSTSSLVVPEGVYYTIPGSQFNAVASGCSATCVVNGTLEDTDGNVTIFAMTPSELVYYAKEGTISGYTWSSGTIGNHTTAHLNVTMAAGQWDLVFVNPAVPARFGGNVTILWFVTGLSAT